MATKIALVGIGKIAVDQHVPAIAASPDWDLAATVSRKGAVDGVQSFTDFSAFLVAPALVNKTTRGTARRILQIIVGV